MLAAELDVTFNSCWVQETDFGLIRHCPQAPDSLTYNSAIILDPDTDLNAAIKSVEAFFHRLHLPSVLRTSWKDWESKKILPFLESNGYQLKVQPCWWLEASLTKSIPTPSVVIKRELEVPSMMDQAFVQHQGELITPTICRLKLSNKINKLYVQRDQDDNFVGMSLLRTLPGAALLEELFVIPSARRQGHGQHLLEKTLDFAQQDGNERIFLLACQPDLKNFVLKRGFQLIPKSPESYWVAVKTQD